MKIQFPRMKCKARALGVVAGALALGSGAVHANFIEYSTAGVGASGIGSAFSSFTSLHTSYVDYLIPGVAWANDQASNLGTLTGNIQLSWNAGGTPLFYADIPNPWTGDKWQGSAVAAFNLSMTLQPSGQSVLTSSGSLRGGFDLQPATSGSGSAILNPTIPGTFTTYSPSLSTNNSSSTWLTSQSNLQLRVSATTGDATYTTRGINGQVAGTGTAGSSIINGGTFVAGTMKIGYEYRPWESSANPFMPYIPPASPRGFWGFRDAGQIKLDGKIHVGGFYDPDVAVGYTFEASDVDTSFEMVMVPKDYGDGNFDLLLWDEATSSFKDSGKKLTKGTWLEFDKEFGTTGGVRKFRIAGIETSAMVDPNDSNGFVTGLTFSGTGHAFTMQAMTEFVEAVPEPETYAMMLAGLGMVGAFARRRRQIGV